METTNVSHFLTALARSSIEAGIVVILVLAAQWLFRKQLSPRWRCALWLLVIGRMLLLFSFGGVTSAFSIFNLLPHWAAPTQVATFAPAVPAPVIDPLSVPQPANQFGNPARRRPVTAPASDPSSPVVPAPVSPAAATNGPAWSWAMWLFAAWLTGVMLLTGCIAVSSWRLWWHCRKLPPLKQPVALTVLEVCCARLDVRHKPALLETTEVSSPALHGLFRPRLLLPKGFTASFSVDELRFVFLHELAHLKRRDLLLNWVMAVLQVMHWFNPLVWLGFARWRADRELACDAMALEAAGEGKNQEYGRTILRLLENFARPIATPGLVGILEDKHQLRRRIGMISSYVPTRGWPRLALALIGVLAVIGLTDAQTAAPSATAATAKPLATVSASTSGSTPPTAPGIAPAQLKGNDMNTSSMTNQIVRAATIGLLALNSPTAAAESPAPAVSPAVPPVSELASQLTGAWILVGTPDKVHKAPAAGGRIKIFAGSHWVVTQADAKTGVVVFHHGGTYTLNGNAYHETVEFANPSTLGFIGQTNGHFTLKLEGDQLTLIGVDNPWKEVWQRLNPAKPAASPLATDLVGTWIQNGKPGETVIARAADAPLKFCAGGYWCDTQIDPKTHVVVIAHGGTYTLKGDDYSETVVYANPTTMPLIGNTFKYTLKVQNDLLTILGQGNPWNEVWKRLD